MTSTEELLKSRYGKGKTIGRCWPRASPTSPSAARQVAPLGATAAGLASLWSTGAAAHAGRVADLCGLDPTDTVVGLVYLGWPVSEPECPPRPEPEVAWVVAEAPAIS